MKSRERSSFLIKLSQAGRLDRHLERLTEILSFRS
jgi:hypothetical protein